MADKVNIEFVWDHDGHKAGDKVSFTPSEAKILIGAGVAVPATVPEAKKVAADPETAATKR